MCTIQFFKYNSLAFIAFIFIEEKIYREEESNNY